jgi:hypothetical protein
MPLVASIAVETSGDCTDVHSLVCISSTIVDTTTCDCVQQHTWVVRVPEDAVWDPQCVAEYWSKRPALQAFLRHGGWFLEECGGRFAHWLQGLHADVSVVVDSAAFTVPWLNVALRVAAHSPMHIGPKGAFRTVLDLKSLQKLEAPAAAAAAAAAAAPAIERHLLTPAGKALLLALQYCQVWDKAVPVPDFHGFTL